MKQWSGLCRICSSTGCALGFSQPTSLPSFTSFFPFMYRSENHLDGFRSCIIFMFTWTKHSQFSMHFVISVCHHLLVLTRTHDSIIAWVLNRPIHVHDYGICIDRDPPALFPFASFLLSRALMTWKNRMEGKVHRLCMYGKLECIMSTYKCDVNGVHDKLDRVYRIWIYPWIVMNIVS